MHMRREPCEGCGAFHGSCIRQRSWHGTSEHYSQYRGAQRGEGGRGRLLGSGPCPGSLVVCADDVVLISLEGSLHVHPLHRGPLLQYVSVYVRVRFCVGVFPNGHGEVNVCSYSSDLPWATSEAIIEHDADDAGRCLWLSREQLSMGVYG